MSSMEPDARQLLNRILKTLAAGVVWIFVNMTLGIYLQLFFFVDHPKIHNIVFYLFFLGSLFLLIRYYRKIWKHDIPPA